MPAWFLSTTVTVTILCMVVLLANRFLRLGPAWRHALWVLVFLKFVIPPLIHWPLSIPQFAPTAASVNLSLDQPNAPIPPEPRNPPTSRPAPRTVAEFAAPDTTLDPAYVAISEQSSILTRATPDSFAADGTAAASHSTSIPITGQTVVTEFPRFPPNGSETDFPIHDDEESVGSVVPPIRTLLLMIWVSGGVWTGVGLVRGVARTSRHVRMGRPAPADLRERTAEICQRWGMPTPRVILIPGHGSPLLWCFGKPCILIPELLLPHLNADRRLVVLAHELAHWKRKDHWISRLECLAALIWWWNPVFWFVRRRLEEAADLACDALVVASWPEKRHLYAETLISICEWISQTERHTLALGFHNARADFSRRLTLIMKGPITMKHRITPIVGTPLCLCAVFLLPSLGWSQQTDPQTPVTASSPVTPRPTPKEVAPITPKASADPFAGQQPPSVETARKPGQPTEETPRAFGTRSAQLSPIVREEPITTTPQERTGFPARVKESDPSVRSWLDEIASFPQGPVTPQLARYLQEMQQSEIRIAEAERTKNEAKVQTQSERFAQLQVMREKGLIPGQELAEAKNALESAVADSQIQNEKYQQARLRARYFEQLASQSQNAPPSPLNADPLLANRRTSEPTDSKIVAELKSQILALQSELETSRKRLAELKSKLGPPKEDNPISQSVQKQLEMVVPMDFKDIPFQQVFEIITEATTKGDQPGIEFYIDPKALELSALTREQPLEIHFKRLPLKTSLRLLLREWDLTYIVKDGIVIVTHQTLVEGF